MKKQIKIIAILALLVAVLIPAAVSAGGVFYCSTSISVGGSGTYSDPWACSTAEQLDTVVNDNICAIYNGGYLYEIYPNSYRYHVVTYYSAVDCRVTSSTDYAGYPPSTGVEVPTPYIVGGAALLGAGLVTAGIIWRRKRTAGI
jgi:hypothetical protein